MSLYLLFQWGGWCCTAEPGRMELKRGEDGYTDKTKFSKYSNFLKPIPKILRKKGSFCRPNMEENELNIHCNSMAKLRKFWHVWHPYQGYLAHSHTPG
jgi:hypothetical protein